MTLPFLPNPRQQFFGNDGNPLAGGKLYTYAAGTSTPKATYTDAAGTIANTNPIVLNARGEATVYWNGSYKVTLTDAASATIYTQDNYQDMGAAITTALAASSGSSLVGFLQSGSSPAARTAQAKMQDFVSVKDFGAVGDGTTDDTTALTNFWNSAIARPGVPHLLDAKTYIFNAALPQINVSNVKIMGAGSYIHNVGSLFTGTMLKWTGGISSGPAIEILSPSGAGNQLKANIEFSGIGLDCNSQLGIGIAVRSIWHSNIDVAVANATLQGVLLTVVAAMGENQSLQRNRIKISSRQIEAPAGVGVYLDGNSVANVSMNEIWLDAVHANNSAVICKNSDNNDWRFVRCYATGSASECVSLLSSNNYGEQARAERFWFLTANKPIQAYGTSTGTYPSTGNQIFCLDKENGTPAPVVATGGVVNWREDDSAMDDNAWLAYTPTITAATGTLTTVASVLGFYRKFGKRVDFKYQWNITTNGTGSVALLATLPVFATGSNGSVCAGKERAVTGKMLSGFIDGGGTGTVSIQYADGTYPGVNGGTYTISGTYECAS